MTEVQGRDAHALSIRGNNDVILKGDSAHNHREEWGIFITRGTLNRTSIPLIGYSIQYAYTKPLNNKWCTQIESMRASIDQASYICHMTHILSHDLQRLPYAQRSAGDMTEQRGLIVSDTVRWSFDEVILSVYHAALTLTMFRTICSWLRRISYLKEEQQYKESADQTTRGS